MLITKWLKFGVQGLAVALLCIGSILAQSVTNDAEITTAVKNKIAAEPSLKGAVITITSAEGIVTLAGSINTDEQMHTAVRLAQLVPGVKRVVSTQLVKDVPPPVYSDATITAKVKETLMLHHLYSSTDVDGKGIKIDTNYGIVYLSGVVGSKEQEDEIIVLVKTIPGVKAVRSTLISAR